jgi:hypothetical protein
MVRKRKYLLTILFLMLSVYFMIGCVPLTENPPSVQPYLNKVCVLKRGMYAYQNAGGIWGGLPGLLNPPTYFLSDIAYTENSIFGKPIGIIPSGIKYSFYRYTTNNIEGYHYVDIKILEGQFAGKIFSFYEDDLLKCFNLKMVKNRFNNEQSPFAQ